jgi:hypothetical protein
LQSIRTLTEAEEYHPESEFGYIKGTRHQDFSDFPLLFPWWMKKVNQSGPLAADVQHPVQDQMIFEFLQKYIRLDPKGYEGIDYQVEPYLVKGQEAFDSLTDIIKAASSK